MNTIRSRMIITSASMLAGALLAASLLVYSTVQRALTQEFDAALAAHAQALATSVELDEVDHDYEYHGANRAENGLAFLIRTRAGRLLAAYGDQTLLKETQALQTSARTTDQELADGRHARQIDFWTHSLIEGKQTPAPGAPDILVRIAGDQAALDHQLNGFSQILAAVGIGVMVLATAALAIGLRAALRPLDRLTTQIAAVDARSLAGRIDAAQAPGELVPTVRHLNHLLDRIQDSVRREQLYSAAIAHELRTPLGALQTILDVHRSKEHPPEAYAEALALCHGISLQMRRLVQGLLLLAQADAGHLRPALEPVDLEQAATTAWAVVAERARKRDLSVAWQIPLALQVVTDHSLLAIILANLLDNAISHSDSGSGSTISVTARCDEVWTTLEIANQGGRLAPEQLARIFDRFWRGDRARTRSDQHAGLGLSLCREILILLSGRIAATCVDDHFCITVDFPRPRSSAALGASSP